MIYVFYIFSVLIAMFLGLFEALLFSTNLRGEHISSFFKRKFKYDIHIFLTLMRFVIFIPMFSVLLPPLNFFFLTSVVFMFPFIHDGFYYLGRKHIDGAYNGFTDVSETTSAIFSLDFPSRTVLFFVSLLTLCVC